MSKVIKTARGRQIDMGTIAAQHQTERAVSNVPINARGDIIDSRGQVKVTREEVKKKMYANNMPGNVEQTSIKQDSSDVAAPTSASSENTIVSQREKERPDGFKYLEIEYADGSMEEKPL